LKGEAEKTGLKINIGKTKTIIFRKESLANKAEVDGMHIDNVNEFFVLGCLLTWDSDCSKKKDWIKQWEQWLALALSGRADTSAYK